jgi:hypothetical protein
MMLMTLLGFTLAASGAEVATPNGFALIITNNRSLDAQRPDLQYADDDGAAYAELLGQVFGNERVSLLTRFDANSAALHGAWPTRAIAPTREALAIAIGALAKRLGDERALGHATELVLIFAGHGDLDAGQGFIELEDARLTAQQFETEVIARLPADRIHVVLDSCNSYFMLNPRKPGGRRWAATATPADGLLTRYKNVGVIVSTSAEAVTYEWSELQSGIFSYEVRSGIRGGADADGDGLITYAELAAFISVANSQVPNDYYRPKVFAQGPGSNGAAVFIDTRVATGRRLELGREGAHRLTVRNSMGVRLIDLHTESGSGGRVLLPEGDALDIAERVAATEKDGHPLAHHYRMPEGSGSQRLEQLTATDAPIAGRGDVPVFRSLFDKPFGPRALELARPTLFVTDPTGLPQGVSQQDADRLRVHLQYAAQGARTQRLVSGGSAAVLGTAVTAGAALYGRSADPERASGALAIGTIGVTLAGTGLAAMFIRRTEESLAIDYSEMNLESEVARSASVVVMERKFEQAAAETRRARRVAGIVGASVGVAGGVFYGFFNRDGSNNLTSLGYLGLGSSLLLIVLGASSFFVETPVERAWTFYLDDSRLGAAPDAPQVTLAPLLGGTPGGATVFGLSGTF